MGTIHKLYPNARDSLDGDLFLRFEKVFTPYAKQEGELWDEYTKRLFPHRKKLLDCLIKDKKYEIFTESQEKILCTLQQFQQLQPKDFVKNPYGRVYQILLEDDEKKRFGCHIEHRLPPSYEESIILNASSWLIHNKKFPRVFSDSIKTQSYKPATEPSLAQMSEK